MPDDQLKEQLMSYAGHGADQAFQPDPGQIRRRGRHHYQRVAALTVAGALLVVGLGVRWANTAPTLNRPQPSVTSQLPVTPTTGTTPTGPPASFVTLVGKRIAVVSTSTGKVLRFLTPANNPNLPGEVVVSEDRQWVYFGKVVWCSPPGLAGLYRVPFAGGPVTRVTHSNLGRFAVSPDGSKLIYQSFRCPDQTNGDLMLHDLATGTERPLPWQRPLPFARPSLGGIAWAPDNRQVAMLLTAPNPGALWLLDTTTGQARQVPMAPPQILQPTALHWPAGSGKIVIALYSNPGRSNSQARVLYVDPATGAQTPLVLNKGRDAGLIYLDVDASGQYLIYTLTSHSAMMTIWWYGGGKPVRLTRAYNQAGANEPGW
jgi:Tol biopolymer transport system component